MKFSKYHGAGNDFVIIDDREGRLDLSDKEIALICDRHFGVGADGLILLRNAVDVAYEMVYHNADGALGSMCGNGARCSYAFAQALNIANGRVHFLAYDGLHEAWSNGNDVSVTMRDVGGIEREDAIFILDTGSPHYVKFVEDLEEIDVVRTGRTIRNIDRFRADGINVNFVEVQRDRLRVSTYERGVEDQTLACGTGVTAVALAYGLKENIAQGPVEIRADGGDLKVDFRRDGELFTEVVLTGPASHVYDGEWPLNHPSPT